MHSRRIGTLAIAALVSSLATIPAHAATDGSQVVISEAYGGGGNSGAAYTHDFIELYNPTDADIDLTGYTVEYFSGKGGSGGKSTLTGSIPAGGHFLIQGGQGNGGTTALPTPDADAGLTMSGTNGAVQLADAAGTTVDTVGYGSATINEGSPVAGASSSQSVFRDAAGTDTDNNAADFTAGAPRRRTPAPRRPARLTPRLRSIPQIRSPRSIPRPSRPSPRSRARAPHPRSLIRL